MLTSIALVAAIAAQSTSGVQYKPLQSAPAPAAIAPGAPAAAIAPPAPQAVILSSPTESVLRSGTEVPLVMAETITTNGKKLRIGQRVRLGVTTVRQTPRLFSSLVGMELPGL